MKLRTKIAVFALAVFLSLVGANLIANGLATRAVAAAHNPVAQVSVQVSNVRVLA
jgi:hypothetical protein